ncbi:MAG: DUF1987 domain-containing protein [Bacteroidales bacterium]|nr:DUF1987 domain-containing protein [Bacteroidales bacterium]
MENIVLTTSPETPYFPEVNFDVQSGTCEIKGESYMEETYKFYLPLITWIKEYCDSNNEIVFNIKLIYLNTSTTKCLLDMLELLKKFEEKGGKVQVNWYYDKSDPDMVDEVEDFEAEAGIKINLIEKE